MRHRIAAGPGHGFAPRRKRVLLVNCYFDHSHRPIHRSSKIPQAVGPIYLAGAFSRELCDVKCYTELASGPLEDEQLLGWPDMLVLTSLTNGFDRLLHLTAYARSKNPKVIVVAGGPAVRALPLLSRHYFDYTCLGDIEELRDVIADAFGPSYAAEEMLPRYDLAYWLGRTGYAETTRYCNFRCSFCALTGEGRPYHPYDLGYMRQQILASGRRRRMFFIDNNFYGNDRLHFQARVGLIKELRQAGQFQHWAALVTSDFYRRGENLTLAKESGCELLFSGVESFDTAWLRGVNKLQNIAEPQVEMIAACLNRGIVFSYGLIVDLATRRITDLRNELEFVASTPQITLPSFVTVPIPLLGTPYFVDALEQGTILPRTKLRDMDGTTITQRPLDPIDDVVTFLKDLQSMRGFRGRLLKHTAQFVMRYRKTLTPPQMIMATGSALIICTQQLSMSLGGLGRPSRGGGRRTHVSTTEHLDDAYTPAFRVASQFRSYFKPTMVTDETGRLHEDLAESGLIRAVSGSPALPLSSGQSGI